MFPTGNKLVGNTKVTLKKRRIRILIIEIYFHPRLKSEVKAAINELGRFDILIEDAASYSLEVNLGSKQRAFDKKYCPKTNKV